MTKRKVVLQSRNNEMANCLMVPWVPQHDADALCFPASLKMVIDYFGTFYGNAVIQNALPKLTFNEVIDLCSASKENGTRISRDLADRITSRLVVLKADLHTATAWEDIWKQESRELPTILIYDGMYALTQVRGSAHAGVYVGRAANGDPVIHNPWVGAYVPYGRPNFEAAWELRERRAIMFYPNPQTDLRRSEGSAEGNGAAKAS